jgi:hypothetical protein
MSEPTSLTRLLLVLFIYLKFLTMKNLVIKNPAAIVGAWFAIIFLVASLVSCGSGHVMCDAYGDSGESCTTLEDDKV